MNSIKIWDALFFNPITMMFCLIGSWYGYQSWVYGERNKSLILFTITLVIILGNFLTMLFAEIKGD